MAASTVGGAALGAVFGELLKAVLKMKDKANMFKQTLASLQFTLVAIAPVIKKIEQHNNDLGRPKEELESLIRGMEEGSKLVSKCSKIRRFDYIKRARYQERLVALVDSLVRFFIIDMQAQTARDQKETLLKVERILRKLNKLPSVSTKDTTGSSSDFGPLPVDVSESEIHDSTEMQTAESVPGTNSADQVRENVTQQVGQRPKIVTVVLKVHMHSEACAQKIKRRIQKMKGVELAEPDLKNSQVSVKGVYDPAVLVDYVYKQTGKQAVIVKQEAEKKKKKAEKKTKEAKEEKKTEEGEKEKKNKGEKNKEKKEEAEGEAKAEVEATTEETKPPKIVTVVLKVHMHCEACPQEIKRCIQKMKGVELVEPDLKNSQVIVKGVYDPAVLVDYVYKKTGKQAVIERESRGRNKRSQGGEENRGR